MKKVLIALLYILVFVSICSAQCVATITDVRQDERKGSILVETEYELNGKVVQTGHTRYLETSGDNSTIIQMAKDDAEEHCENLIKRLPVNTDYIITEKLKIQKSLTAPIINDIKDDLINYQTQINKATENYKDKVIGVTYDSKNTVGNLGIIE